MSELASELRGIYKELHLAATRLEITEFVEPLEALEVSAKEIGKAWSHSWLGYQSRVYYSGLKPPPPGAHFSIEWGMDNAISMGTRGAWQQFPESAVETEIRNRAGNPDTSKVEAASAEVRDLLQKRLDDIVSILRIANEEYSDTFFDKLLEEAGALRVPTAADFVNFMRPSGRVMSRDMIAAGQGFWAPPHLSIVAEVTSIRAPKVACESLSSIARRAFSHLERIEKKRDKSDRIGTNIFIGHGRSKEWKDLKDFVNDRLRLPWDEFNCVPVAGIPNTVRLATMLDAAAIAFLVLTAEDERADGALQARMNVIHEVGLFQGRLGFTRAIVMLEDGCDEFSNIAGLGQIRFPKGNIRAAFHDVELVLEREGLIYKPA